MGGIGRAAELCWSWDLEASGFRGRVIVRPAVESIRLPRRARRTEPYRSWVGIEEEWLAGHMILFDTETGALDTPVCEEGDDLRRAGRARPHLRAGGGLLPRHRRAAKRKDVSEYPGHLHGRYRGDGNGSQRSRIRDRVAGRQLACGARDVSGVGVVHIRRRRGHGRVPTALPPLRHRSSLGGSDRHRPERSLRNPGLYGGRRTDEDRSPGARRSESDPIRPGRPSCRAVRGRHGAGMGCWPRSRTCRSWRPSPRSVGS